MDGSCLARHFGECRLPLSLLDVNPIQPTGYFRRRRRRTQWVALDAPEDRGFFVDVRTEGRDERFEVFIGSDFEVEILDEDREKRHILLMAKNALEKGRYLFGHDERHLFVLRLPGNRATSLAQAFEELKPAAVVRAQDAKRPVIRQGEWFFIPVDGLVIPKGVFVQRKVPIEPSRHPHVADELVRWPLRRRRQSEYRSIVTFVRGRVRHVDHATIELDRWHRVVMNVEDRMSGAVGFVD